MSKKCRAYSESNLGLEPSDNRKAFYAGWEAALRAPLAEPPTECKFAPDGVCERLDCPTCSAEPVQAEPITDAMMNVVDRLGSEYDQVDPRAWQHLLVYAPKAEPVGEPVAWMSPDKKRLEFSRKDAVYGSHTIPLYTTPQPQQPVELYASMGVPDVPKPQQPAEVRQKAGLK